MLQYHAPVHIDPNSTLTLTPNPEPRTPNPEPRTPNPEPRTCATRQASVRVGGVPPDMSDLDLRELFRRSGTILSLQVRVRMGAGGEGDGFREGEGEG
jgi:hypothetical protein